MQNVMGMPNMMQNGMFQMGNPMFYNYQYMQMMQNQNRLMSQNIQNVKNNNFNVDLNDEKKSVKSFDKSRDPSNDKSISTIKSTNRKL